MSQVVSTCWAGGCAGLHTRIDDAAISQRLPPSKPYIESWVTRGDPPRVRSRLGPSLPSRSSFPHPPEDHIVLPVYLPPALTHLKPHCTLTDWHVGDWYPYTKVCGRQSVCAPQRVISLPRKHAVFLARATGAIGKDKAVIETQGPTDSSGGTGWR